LCIILDCEELYTEGFHLDGVYAISPDGRCPFFVYCDMTNGGWTVIQVLKFIMLIVRKVSARNNYLYM